MFWIVLAAALIGIDQWTKWFFYTNQTRFENFEVIKDFFYLTYLENRGAAFGILQNYRWVFIALTIAALFLMIWYFIRHSHPLLRTALILLIAGGAGNLIDRIFRGYVVDFLHFYPFGYDFAVFNIADACVSIGVGLLIIYLIFVCKEPKKEPLGKSEGSHEVTDGQNN